MSTEASNPNFADLDLWTTDAIVRALADDQALAVRAVVQQVPALAAAADAAAERLKGDGRLIYMGAGTSGRLAVQDGVELGPTYDWPDARLVFALAGGERALTSSVEGAEDDGPVATAWIARTRVKPADVVVAVAASGRTAFTVAGLVAARAAGALTIGLANNPDTPLLEAAEHPIVLDTGPEAVAGSTRMKAGTAQKIALNVLSTAIMARLGGVYRGQMVGMRVANAKLRARAVRMVAELAAVSAAAADEALGTTGGRIKPAVLVAMGEPLPRAENLLAGACGDLRTAISARMER